MQKENKETFAYAETDRATVPFDWYRQLCDESPSYRHLGILYEEAFNAAATDPETIFLQDATGKKYPMVVPIGYEDGYEANRCQNLLGSDRVMLLSLPLHLLGEFDYREAREALADVPIIVEVANDNDVHQLEDLAKELNKEIHTIDDPRIKDPVAQPATFSLFQFKVSPGAEAQRIAVAEQGIYEAWSQYKSVNNLPDEPSIDSDETYLYSAQELAASPDLQQALWDITCHGFGDVLGSYHPVSMEVNREFFLDHIMQPGTLISVKYLEGQPVCFGTVSDDVTNYPWINPDSTKLPDDGSELLIFSEVISGGERGQRLAPDVTKTITDVFALTGKRYTVWFESTNFSRRYICPITIRTIRESLMEFTESEAIEELDTLHYFVLR